MKTIRPYLMYLCCLVLPALHARAETGPLPPDCRVLQVYRGGNQTNQNFAHKGQAITIVATNLEGFFNCNVVSNDLRTRGITASAENLVPFINHIPLVGCKLLFDSLEEDHTHKLMFKLNRDAADATSKEHWNELFTTLPFFAKQKVDVSVGFAGGWAMPSDVSAKSDRKSFSFVVVPIDQNSLPGFILILLAFIGFCALASTTDIIRDPFGPQRPDGSSAFSLARTQMAFWFFLVVGSFFLLWRVTGDTDTITQSLLILMGISSGTALGAALVDAGQAPDGGRAQYFRPLTESGGREAQKQARQAIVSELTRSKQELQTRLTGQLGALQALPATALVECQGNLAEQSAIEESLRRTDIQLAFYQRGKLWRFMTDLLGDDGVISFHRFQIAAWTLVLGIIFVEQVATQLAMPEFNATLLGLMGISSGTYIGFKIPAARN